MHENGDLSKDNKGKTLLLNKAFSSVFAEMDILNVSAQYNFDLGTEEDNLTLKATKKYEIIHYLQKLIPKRLTGPDDLSPRGFKGVRYNFSYDYY